MHLHAHYYWRNIGIYIIFGHVQELYGFLETYLSL